MKRLMFALCLSGAIAGHSSAGWAGTKSFYIDRGDLLNSSSEPSGSESGVLLPGFGVSGVRFAMVLPRNYRKNSKIRIRLFLSGEATGCSYTLVGSLVTRARTGKVTTLNNAGPSGLEPSSFVDVPAPAVAGEGFAKDFTLSPAKSGPFAGSQRAGDRITLMIERDAVLDDCAFGLLVEDIKVIYKTP